VWVDPTEITLGPPREERAAAPAGPFCTANGWIAGDFSLLHVGDCGSPTRGWSRVGVPAERRHTRGILPCTDARKSSLTRDLISW